MSNQQESLFKDPEEPPRYSKAVPKEIGAQILESIAASIEPKERPHHGDMRLLILDARALLDAAYYAAQEESRRNHNGAPMGGVAGYASGLFQLLNRTAPTHAIATFDHPKGSSARKAMMSSYKDRPDKPLEHLAQIDVAMRLTRAVGITSICTEAGEADDVVATLVRRAPKEARITIYSTDKDLLQLLIRPHTKTIWRRRGQWHEAVGHAGALARLGVRCDQVADFLALAGDSADGVPGCPGIGAKTAQRLLELHGNIDTIYARIGKLGIASAPRIAELLMTGRAKVLAARAVVTLRSDLECSQLPVDAAAISNLVWAWECSDVGTLEAIGRETGIGWLQREAQVLGQPDCAACDFS